MCCLSIRLQTRGTLDVRFISKHILTGLATILPVALTLYFIYWLIVSVESLLGGLIKAMSPPAFYWPGMGLIAGLIVLFLVGLLMHAYVVQRLFAKGEQVLYNMPVVKSVYRSIRDFFDYFSRSGKKEFEQVVAVSIGDTGMELIGFVTQHDHEKLPQGFGSQDSVLVYLPMSYMIGGYAVLMPRSAIRPLDLNMEEAMRFTLTAGVAATAHASAESTHDPR